MCLVTQQSGRNVQHTYSARARVGQGRCTVQAVAPSSRSAHTSNGSPRAFIDATGMQAKQRGAVHRHGNKHTHARQLGLLRQAVRETQAARKRSDLGSTVTTRPAGVQLNA